MSRSISVIVPSYNSARTIPCTLEGLMNQTVKPQEIIIVDSSDDGATPQLLSGFRSEIVNLIGLPEPAPPATARNIGASKANGEVLAFIDADACPAPDWLEKIAKAFDEGCLAGGGSVAVADFQKNRPLALAQLYLQFNEYLQAGQERTIRFVPSCNMFCQKLLFKRLGGFPEMRASEDILFCLRVGKVAPVWFIPGVRVNHIFREDLKSFLQNQILLGKYAIPYRKESGGSLIYNGWLPLLLLPAFWFLKPARMIWRVLKAGPGARTSFIKAVPLFFLGLISWNIGLIQGLSPRR